jgi:hypothetical protein
LTQIISCSTERAKLARQVTSSLQMLISVYL